LFCFGALPPDLLRVFSLAVGVDDDDDDDVVVAGVLDLFPSLLAARSTLGDDTVAVVVVDDAPLLFVCFVCFASATASAASVEVDVLVAGVVLVTAAAVGADVVDVVTLVTAIVVVASLRCACRRRLTVDQPSSPDAVLSLLAVSLSFDVVAAIVVLTDDAADVGVLVVDATPDDNGGTTGSGRLTFTDECTYISTRT
jgi:hypothetical protein